MGKRSDLEAAGFQPLPGKGFRDSGFVVRTEGPHRANHPRAEGFGARGERTLPRKCGASGVQRRRLLVA